MRRAVSPLRGLLAALLALTIGPRVASAERCRPAGEWVLAVVEAPPPPGLKVADVLDQLGIELAMRRRTLCTEAPAASREPAVGRVLLSQPSAGAAKGSVWIEIEARDGVATKRATREVDLSLAPRDRSATVVALAAYELLRAAWEELELARTALPPDAAAATSPEPVPARAPGPAAPAADARGSRVGGDTLGLGLRAGGELWTGGLLLWGGDAAVSIRAGTGARVELLAGARAAMAQDAADGSVGARALCARLGGSLVLTPPRAAAELAIGARLGAYALRLAGDPMPGAQGHADSAAAFTIEAGPTVRVPFSGGPALVVDVGLAAALRGVDARDGAEVVTGLSGAALTTSVGFVAGVL